MRRGKLSILGVLLLLQCCVLNSSFAQYKDVKSLNQSYLNWYNLDFELDKVLGVSVDRAYVELLKDRAVKKKVVVAVIDSGVDIYHEDLKGKIWTNKNEIPGNNIDDDKNGYIDDIHGWNFIGNAEGENVRYENLEHARIVKERNLLDPNYLSAKELYDFELAREKDDKIFFGRYKQGFQEAKQVIEDKTGEKVTKPEDLNRIHSLDPQVRSAKHWLLSRYALDITEADIDEFLIDINEYLDYFLNLEFNPRNIVGDDPRSIDDKDYGNANVVGSRSDHGTSVAGVIAAIRDNGYGINGIAEHVEIMAIRAVPMGDERDKDIALSIRYAVDNGADIVNMSFGKSFSPQKNFVDDAVKYAEEKGVLLVHGSGNDGENMDIAPDYPTDNYDDGTIASNWLNVGASDLLLNKELIADFSNYGKQEVDLFAPGVHMITTDSSSTYSEVDGTSFSAPVASGVAALLLAYYPHLSPEQLIDILMSTTTEFTKPKRVYKPTLTAKRRKKIKLSKLSVSAGIINAYEALIEAEKRSH